MLTSQWYREKYLLDRMTFRDLTRAYILYPSIQIYAVLLALQYNRGLRGFPLFPCFSIARGRKYRGDAAGLSHSWNMLYIGLSYMGDTSIGRHGRQLCGNGFTMIITKIPMICGCCLEQVQPPCRRLLWPPSQLE